MIVSERDSLKAEIVRATETGKIVHATNTINSVSSERFALATFITWLVVSK